MSDNESPKNDENETLINSKLNYLKRLKDAIIFLMLLPVKMSKFNKIFKIALRQK